MPFFEHEGIKFHWQERGAGKPFVFQHGLGGETAQPLALFSPPDGIRLISFDCRAHGKTQSADSEANIGFTSLVGDLRALLDHLEIERAVVGGISMGAALALRFTLEYSPRVAGLVLSRPAWLDQANPFNVRAYDEIAVLIREHGTASGREIFAASEFFRSVGESSPEAAASLLSQFDFPRATEEIRRLECIPHQLPHPDRGAWAALRVPTLILAAHGDPIHPFAYAQVLAATIPGASLHELVSKYGNYELHRVQTQQRIEEFLKEIEW